MKLPWRAEKVTKPRVKFLFGWEAYQVASEASLAVREGYQAARGAYFSVGKLTKWPVKVPWRPEKVTKP